MKQQFSIILCLTALSFLIITGCNKDDSGTNPPTTTGFRVPNVGDRATFRMISGPDTGSFYYTVNKKFANNIYRILQVLTWQFRPTETDTLYWYITPTDWKEVSDSNGTLSGLRLFTDMEVNKEYTYTTFPNSPWGANKQMSYKLTSKTEQVTVPCGTFSSYKVILTCPSDPNFPETFIYYAPGTGNIKYTNAHSLVELLSKNF